jgi:hypothetical protein
MPDYKTSNTLTDKQILAKVQELRAQYPAIEFSRGFDVTEGYLMITADQPPVTPGLDWVPNEHDDTVRIAATEEEVALGEE